MITVTGLWKNKTKEGKPYLKGTMAGVDVLIFPVENKKSEKLPDYTLCFAEHKKQENDNNPFK